jgi:magnesium transporter
MLTVYYKNGDALFSAPIEGNDPVPKGALWIDMVNPTLEEEKRVEDQLRIEIPTREEVWKNQVLNRFYSENGVHYMTAALITKIDSPFPQTSSVTFILTEKYLATIRYISPTSFSNFSNRFIRAPKKFHTGVHVLEGLLEEIITRVAHNSEIVVEELDKLSHDIFSMDQLTEHCKNPSQLMKGILKRLGTSADLNSKINESLHSISRLLNFLKQVHGQGKEIDDAVATLSTDTNALTKQTAFLSDKITFQLDATLGMINVEQNVIIKMFSIATVFFLPMTLISSIYGMNFQHMPELQWQLGYPFAIAMMLGSAGIAYAFFRRKGWM